MIRRAPPVRMAFAALAVAAGLAPLGLTAQDTLVLRDGSLREGGLLGFDDKVFRLRIPPPNPGQPSAVITVNRADVERIRFGPDAAFDQLSKSPAPESLAAVRALWQKREPWLPLPESNAGEVGCFLGELLLTMPGEVRHKEALDVFRLVEERAWSEAVRARARAGRVRAMFRLGAIEEASAEAVKLAQEAGDPELLLETNFLLGQVRYEELKRLLEDNPRWDEDPPIRRRRQELIHEAADLLLHAYLFHGTQREAAARGLWQCRELYLLAGDRPAADELAADLVAIYPETGYAARVRETLHTPPTRS